MSHFAWLIEGDRCYWNGHYADGRGFTRNVNEAIRFSREEDADTVKNWLMEPCAFALRTTGHYWLDAVVK